MTGFPMVTGIDRIVPSYRQMGVVIKYLAVAVVYPDNIPRIIEEMEDVHTVVVSARCPMMGRRGASMIGQSGCRRQLYICYRKRK